MAGKSDKADSIDLEAGLVLDAARQIVQNWAEVVATLDVLSGGRFVGVGRFGHNQV
ncbi:MAG TPA: hypothetical protein VK386_02965 [Acidimicrobiales bacterium]|nr:hypothetical protein [Acidimicrobiales bacterium]